jgi:hypothetical protein
MVDQKIPDYKNQLKIVTRDQMAVHDVS